MREVVLDTETTGLKVEEGNRIVEVGCVELMNHLPTGRVFQAYCNPGRPMEEGAAKVTGLSDHFLAKHKPFAALAEGLVAFLEDSPLVIHNAAFDLGFLNAEFKRLKLAPLEDARAIDTAAMARRKFPGAPAKLDYLCKRFGIDLSEREAKGHGALLDAKLTAEVYLQLIGGRQKSLGLAADGPSGALKPEGVRPQARPRPLAPLLTPEEAAAHAAFIASFKGEAVWKD